MRYHLDIGDPDACVALGLCDEAGCGARFLANSRQGALALLSGHRTVAHPDLRNLPMYNMQLDRKRAAA